jgi:hypothetical protein
MWCTTPILILPALYNFMLHRHVHLSTSSRRQRSTSSTYTIAAWCLTATLLHVCAMHHASSTIHHIPAQPVTCHPNTASLKCGIIAHVASTASTASTPLTRVLWLRSAMRCIAGSRRDGGREMGDASKERERTIGYLKASS